MLPHFLPVGADWEQRRSISVREKRSLGEWANHGGVGDTWFSAVAMMPS
jgi:hypothetical protein